jgi:hypothetical protein
MIYGLLLLPIRRRTRKRKMAESKIILQGDTL